MRWARAARAAPARGHPAGGGARAARASAGGRCSRGAVPHPATGAPTQATRGAAGRRAARAVPCGNNGGASRAHAAGIPGLPRWPCPRHEVRQLRMRKAGKGE